jgi:hypothetical protein
MPSYRADIEVPFTGRDGDPGARAAGDPDQRLHRVWEVLPYPVAELLAAQPGTFDLAVDVKHDDRVVGSWSVECNPPDPSGLLVCHVRSMLYVCGSPAGNPRESGAFLAISSWWVNADDPKQSESLYACLGEEVIARLASLLGDEERAGTGERQSLVLYLLDVRRRDRRKLSLAVLEAALLLELADGDGVPGVDLKVAHGRGGGSSPIAGFGVNPTLPMPLGFGEATSGDRRGQVFVRETVTPANTRWNRRASDRPAPAADDVEADAEATVAAWVPPRTETALT